MTRTSSGCDVLLTFQSELYSSHECLRQSGDERPTLKSSSSLLGFFWFGGLHLYVAPWDPPPTPVVALFFYLLIADYLKMLCR